jgi:hypothetical protein
MMMMMTARICCFPLRNIITALIVTVGGHRQNCVWYAGVDFIVYDVLTTIVKGARPLDLRTFPLRSLPSLRRSYAPRDLRSLPLGLTHLRSLPRHVRELDHC